MELFGVLPEDTGEAAFQLRHLPLLSNGLTAPSAIMWERLLQTARNVLDKDGQYPDEDHVVQDPGCPDVSYGSLSTEH